MAKKRVHRVRARPRRSRLPRLSIVPETRLCCRCQDARANYLADLRTEVIQMEAHLGLLLAIGLNVASSRVESCSQSMKVVPVRAGEPEAVSPLRTYVSDQPVVTQQSQVASTRYDRKSRSDALHRPVIEYSPALRPWCGH